MLNLIRTGEQLAVRAVVSLSFHFIRFVVSFSAFSLR